MREFNPLTSNKTTRVWLLAITWVAFLLRVNLLSGQSLWRDEVDTRIFAGWTLQEHLSGMFAIGHNGPLYFLLLRPWVDYLGASEFTLRFPSAAMGALAVPLMFVLARQLGLSRRTGLITGLLLATSPYLVWYGQEAKMYTLLLALVLAALIAYLKALAGGQNRWWVIFVVVTSVSFYVHILSPLMLPVYGVIALMHRAQLRGRWRPWWLSMAWLTVPYVPFVVWELPLLWTAYNSGHPFYPLQQEIEILLQLYSSGLLKSLGQMPIILLLFLLLAGLFLTNPRARAENLSPGLRLMLAAWVLLPPLMVYLVSLRVAVFEDRYLIYITPGFYLVAALGIILIRFHSRQVAAFCLGLMLVINLIGIWQQQRQPIKADFRAAAAYLAARPIPPQTVMIQIPYLEKTFGYYYPHPYKLLEGLWTNNGKTEAQVNTEMVMLTHNLSDLWLVVAEETLWDDRQLMRHWLNRHADLIDEAHFTRIDVYHYQFQPGSIESQSLPAQ